MDRPATVLEVWRDQTWQMRLVLPAAMIGSFGHGGPHPLLYLADYRETTDIIAYHHVRAAVHQELSSAFDETMRILKNHRPALRNVAERLMKYRRITGDEVYRILAATGTRLNTAPASEVSADNQSRSHARV